MCYLERKFYVCVLTMIIKYLCLVNGSELSINDQDSIKISLLPESDVPLNVKEEDKPILRYGFHRTQNCQVFEKAFICIRKCLDMDFHIAHADKACICTCYKNSVLAKYKTSVASTLWKLGAPTTSLPPWVKGNDKPDDYEMNANVTDFNEDEVTDAIVIMGDEGSGDEPVTGAEIASDAGEEGETGATDVTGGETGPEGEEAPATDGADANEDAPPDEGAPAEERRL